MKVISTTKAPAAIGPYSQAIEVNGFVYASGQIPIDPATGQFVEGGIKEQTQGGWYRPLSCSKDNGLSE